MFKKFLYLPNDSIRVRVKGKIINRRGGCELKNPVEYIFYGNEKSCSMSKESVR